MDSCARGAPWIGTGFPASGFLALPNWVQAASISNSAVATTRIRVGRRGARNALVCIGCSWCLGRRVGQTLDIGFLRHTIQTQAFASHQRDAPWYKHESARIGLDRRECSPAALYGSEPGSSNWYVDQQEPMRDSTAWKTMVRPERFELPASWFVARRSIQLSYGRIIYDLQSWRRGRDSNPRWAFDPYALSRGAPSTTRPPLPSGTAPT